MTIVEDDSIFNILKPRSKGVRCRNLESDPCNKYLDINKTKESIEKECLGKDVCSITNFQSFLKRDNYFTKDENYNKCIDDDSLFYV